MWYPSTPPKSKYHQNPANDSANDSADDSFDNVAFPPLQPFEPLN